MRHFKRIARGVEIGPLLEEIESQPDAWNSQVGRQDRAPAQRETNSIPLRGLRKSKMLGRRRRDVQESRYTALAQRFPAIVAFIERFAAEQDADVGRAKIARLPPGQRVYAHVDRGNYYRHHDRYHVVLKSPKGSPLRAGKEKVRMREGEFWWFDNKAEHDAVNDGDQPRIHLIFDLKPRSVEKLRSPSPARADDEAESRPIEDLLEDARQQRARHEAEIIREAARLYVAGLDAPESWAELLEQQGFKPQDDSFQPIRATIRLLAPEAGEATVRRLGRALVWSLERIERGELRREEVADAIMQAGGTQAVARLWKSEQKFV